MVTVVTPNALRQVSRGTGAVLARRLQIRLQLGKRALSRTQVSRLESLPQSREIAADRIAARSGLRPALRLIRQHLLQCRVSLLSTRQVSGLERTGQLFKILHDLLAAALLLRLRRAGYERNGRS